MKAADVMTRDVISVRLETTVEEIANLLLKNRISGVPVVDADRRVIGIVTEADLLGQPSSDIPRAWWLEAYGNPSITLAEIGRSKMVWASEIMTRNVVTVDDDMPLAALAGMLARRRIKRVPVVRDGRLVGIVSRADVIAGFAEGPKNPRRAPLDEQC